MQIGIISDIHGFIEGLNSALDFFNSQGVDLIVCAGDLVERGEHNDAVVARIIDENISCVQGNHDFMARKNQAYLRRNPKLLDLIGSINDENVTFLDSLPKTLRFQWEGLPVLLAHGTPWDNDTYLYPASKEELFRRVVDEANADVIVLGHTHRAMMAYVGDVLVVNPGSVSISYGEHKRTCGILSMPEREFSVYDLDSRQQIKPLGVRYE